MLEYQDICSLKIHTKTKFQAFFWQWNALKSSLEIATNLIPNSKFMISNLCLLPPYFSMQVADCHLHPKVASAHLPFVYKQ